MVCDASFISIDIHDELGIYWAVTSLALMGKLDEFDKNQVIDQVLSCQCPNGGFGGNTGFDAHLLFTTSAIQILVIYNALDRMDIQKTVDCTF